MVHLKNFIRGTGKGYCSLNLPATVGSVQAQLALASDRDEFLPCEVYQKPLSSEWIISFPLIKRTCTLTLIFEETYHCASGNDTSSFASQSSTKHRTKKFRLTPLKTTYLAKAHSYFNKEDAVTLRGSEKIYGAQTTSIDVENILPNDEKVVILGSIHKRPVKKSSLSEKTSDTAKLRVLDTELKVINSYGESVLTKTIKGSEFRRDANEAFASIALTLPCIDTYTIYCNEKGETPDKGELSEGNLSQEARPPINHCAFLSIPSRQISKSISSWHTQTMSAGEDPSYEDWFFNHSRVSLLERKSQSAAKFKDNPLISIIVPLFKTPSAYFTEMLNSVLSQTYENWELILVNASPEYVCLQRDQIDEPYFIPEDERIKIINLEENLGIALNTQKGINAAKGDFVAFADHDDFLEPDALYEYVKGINDYPSTDLLYCDEDKFERGHYFAPFFKPDWSPDLLLSFNYVTHMLCIRRTLLQSFEPLEKQYEGAQDYHLTWQAAEKARNIFHVRKVLYHWRLHEESTAKNSDAKPYTNEAGKRVIAHHLKQVGMDAKPIDSKIANMYQLDFKFKHEPLVSIIIPNCDHVEELRACIDSIFNKSTYSNYEIVIVENNSNEKATFDFYEDLKKDARVRIVNVEMNGVFNYSKVINEGAREAKGNYLLLLNNDVEVLEKNWIEQLLGFAQREDVGAVGAKLLFPNGLIQHAGICLNYFLPGHLYYLMPRDNDKYYNLLNSNQNLLAVTGACLLVRKSHFEAVGGMDESLPVDYNDVDFCLKLVQKGLYNVYAAQAVLLHKESATRLPGEKAKNKKGFLDAKIELMRRWPRYLIDGDPFMNPNEATACTYHQLK